MLHLTSGDVNADRLREAGLPGDVVACVDALHEGPVAEDERARFVAAAGWATYEDAFARLAEADRALARAADEPEVVLWFEHDLHCQLMLVRLLAVLGAIPAGGTKLAVVCIGSHPEVEKFRGLGDLGADQLAALFADRAPVTDEQLELGRRTWLAFSSADPSGIEGVLAGPTDALPFLRAALGRYLEEFPALDTGLSRTERNILATAAVTTGIARRELFSRSQRIEATPFMTDRMIFGEVDRLARVEPPLLAVSAETVTITPIGHDVLAGRRDAIALHGVDRWRGGVHLHATREQAERVWRWDAGAGRLVRPARAGHGGPS